MSPPIIDALTQHFQAQGMGEVAVSYGTFVLNIEPASLLPVVNDLKSRFGFDLLLDVTAVDWPKREPRFDVVSSSLLHHPFRARSPEDPSRATTTRRSIR